MRCLSFPSVVRAGECFMMRWRWIYEGREIFFVRSSAEATHLACHDRQWIWEALAGAFPIHLEKKVFQHKNCRSRWRGILVGMQNLPMRHIFSFGWLTGCFCPNFPQAWNLKRIVLSGYSAAEQRETKSRNRASCSVGEVTGNQSAWGRMWKNLIEPTYCSLATRWE